MAFSKYDPALTMEKIQTMLEGQFFDRKSARLAPKDLAHHLSAFANASGGLIALGLEDNGSITGVEKEEENTFRKVAFDFLRTSPEYFIESIPCKTEKGSDSQIMLFHITPCANDIILLKSGEAYLRVGDSSRKLSAEQLSSLEYSKGIKSFESRIIDDATMNDLNQALLDKYIDILNPTVGSQVDILKSRGLIKIKDGNIKLTVAAILLFGNMPTQFLPGARVRFLRYEGVTAGVGAAFNVVKDITLEEPLQLLLENGKALLASQMREFQQLGKDGVFHKIPEYPEFAWLEGLVNAIAHRDYSLQGDYIRISMFDDRIEFLSPGKLPSIVTVDNIQTTRFSRNPIIARVLSDFGWVRELNEGVKRIYTDMASFFLDAPVFTEPNGNTVQLVLKNNIAARSVRRLLTQKVVFKDTWKDLNAIERDILLLIANRDRCTPKDVILFTERSRPTVLAHLTKLTELGLIIEHSTSKRDPTKYYTLRY